MSVDAVTRQEMYLQYLAGDTAITLPEPVTRIEKYWWDIAKRIESGIGTGGGITVDSALSETSTNPVQNKVVSKRFGEISEHVNGFGGTVEITSGNPTKAQTVMTIDPSGEEVSVYTADEVDQKLGVLSEQKADKTGMTLGVHTDGFVYLFINGTPQGNGLDIQTEVVQGDVFGYVDEENNIVLSGALPDGTYTLKYEDDEGNVMNIGTMVVGQATSGSIELVWAEGVKLDKETGTEGSGSGYAASQHIKLVDGYSYTFHQKESYGGVNICYYDADGNGLGYELLWDAKNGSDSKVLTPISGAKTFRVRLYYTEVNGTNGFSVTYEKTA